VSGDVSANGRSILHKGHGQTHVCAPPDVCKTPSPGGPVPVPYVNIATDSNIVDAADSVRINGNAMAHVGSKVSVSSGDEAGTAGGLLSSKFKGSMTWKMGSLDVKAEGECVVRFLDTGLHNGNSFNSAFVNQGGTGVAYADDFRGLCPICDQGPEEHRVLETPNTAALCAELVRQLTAQFRAQAGAPGRQRYAKKRSGGRWGGYMVGVMVCKCGQVFAAMSGNSLPGFDAVAGGIGTVVGGGGASVAEMAQANMSASASAPQKLQAIGDAAARIDALRANQDNRAASRGYNPPGVCAGAKLMARSGHAPLNMTEMFFLPPWGATYSWYRTERTADELADASGRMMRRLLRNRFSRRQETYFTTDESVASCHSCQELLFMTNCPERNC
jgi:hypothetical protein